MDIKDMTLIHIDHHLDLLINLKLVLRRIHFGNKRMLPTNKIKVKLNLKYKIWSYLTCWVKWFTTL